MIDGSSDYILHDALFNARNYLTDKSHLILNIPQPRELSKQYLEDIFCDSTIERSNMGVITMDVMDKKDGVYIIFGIQAENCKLTAEEIFDKLFVPTFSSEQIKNFTLNYWYYI